MKDEHTYGKKMARKGRTKVIYKGTFICIQTLHGKKYHSKCLIDVSKFCAELYFKKFEELSWVGYTFPKFKVSVLTGNLTQKIGPLSIFSTTTKI